LPFYLVVRDVFLARVRLDGYPRRGGCGVVVLDPGCRPGRDCRVWYAG